MSTAGTSAASERLSYELVEARPRKPSAKAAWLSAGLLLTASAALGYHATTLRAERDSAQGTLQAANGALLKLREEYGAQHEKLRRVIRDNADQSALVAHTKAELEASNAELGLARAKLGELSEERREINQQLAEFRQMSRELKRMIDSGRLKVTFRRGRMIVELPAQVLFPSGSADLTGEGKEALGQVAKSLRGFSSRHFIVAGHTDNVPVSGRFGSNWELSTARAVNVTEALIRGGLRPDQLVAAGYGEHDPVARNTSEAGKQKNRRIEIVLEPRLRELPANKAGAK